MRITFKGQTLHLHPRKAIYWEEAETLLIADLHLGKAAHFRKGGLAVPSSVFQENMDNLNQLLMDFQPPRVLFLGDLFHSYLNATWEQFIRFIAEFPHTDFELVQGNHDILPADLYQNAGLKVFQEPHEMGPFLFSHHPLDMTRYKKYNFYGHLHPGVLLEELGSQNLKLPCFFFGEQQAVLPAFGAFTGLAIMRPRRGDQVYVIAENEVIEM